jgi:hypothetical protein
MKLINLKSGEERVITDFSIFKGGVIQRQNMQAVAIIATITPVMVVGRHDNKLYFGMNDKYEIYKTDLQGKDLGGFTLEREKSSATLKQKEQVMLDLVKGLAPPEIAKQLAKSLPDKETYYSNILSHNGMLYLYKSAFVPGNRQQIDIISLEGKYLYRGIIKVKEGTTIAIAPTFHKDYLYIALEDEADEITINKYKTVLPQQ